MGRREDGAAARRRPEIRPDPAGSMTGEIPPSIDAAPRALEQRTPKHPGDGGAPLAGIRTRRQELADRRGWSTFSKARPVLVAERRKWSAGRRLAPSRSEETPRKRLIERPRPPLTGSLASSRVCRRSAPLGEPRIAIRGEGVPGADTTTRAMSHACAKQASPPRAALAWPPKRVSAKAGHGLPRRLSPRGHTAPPSCACSRVVPPSKRRARLAFASGTRGATGEPAPMQQFVRHRRSYRVAYVLSLGAACAALAGCVTDDTVARRTSADRDVAAAAPAAQRSAKAATPKRHAAAASKDAAGYSAVGLASWYGADFHGRRTADGETFNMHSLTAAHRTLPLQCTVRVTNLANHRSLLGARQRSRPLRRQPADRPVGAERQAARLLRSRRRQSEGRLCRAGAAPGPAARRRRRAAVASAVVLRRARARAGRAIGGRRGLD